MDFFDNHCDTVSYLWDTKQDLASSDGQLSLAKASGIARWGQVFAICVDDALDAAARWADYNNKVASFQKQLAASGGKVKLCRTASALEEVFAHKSCAAILAVENGAALGGDITRLAQLHADGVRLLTLTWFGENELGCGSRVGGAFKPFGRQVLQALPQYGIVPDISHLSDEGVAEVFALYEGTVVASHSNVRAVTNHFRNLTDAQIDEIVRRNGIIGINFYPPFLREGGEPHTVGFEELHRHLDAYLSRGAQNSVCFGSDFDGATMPQELKDISGMQRLYDYLLGRGLAEATLHKVFFENAFSFWKKHLGEGK